MKLLQSVEQIPEVNVVATIGNFDGVHLGHQNLIKALRRKAKELKLPSCVILFEPQPREYFLKDKAPARLSTLREKLDVLKISEVDYVVCIKFDKDLAETKASDFAIKHLFVNSKIKYLLVGQDFRFGKNREGELRLLQSLGEQYDCSVATCADFLIDYEKVSSTKIRMALAQGDLKKAALYLGRTYSICGRVIYGDGRGRQWGIPTANLSVHRAILPLAGVFVVRVRVDSKWVNGVANIGKRPTIDGAKNILEVHLFDFDQLIYGKLLQVFFLHKMRDEVKFTSVDALIAQIHVDIAAAKAFFNSFVE